MGATLDISNKYSVHGFKDIKDIYRPDPSRLTCQRIIAVNLPVYHIRRLC